ncbi:MAG: hypothetical protein KGJ60_00905 [Verrucomicrobiota bacterium]|nr:hypothetical protein [Verrucomicrobiota bacterium]MDE3066087.1 hypothetical protein [Verrucomicrobiota bacterium]
MQVDAADDLALLKADGAFAPLPVISSRAVKLGGTVATVGFPDPGLQGFAPKLAKGEIVALSGAGDDARYFQISAVLADGHQAAGQFGRGARGCGGERGGRRVGQGACARPAMRRRWRRAGRCRRMSITRSRAVFC